MHSLAASSPPAFFRPRPRLRSPPDPNRSSPEAIKSPINTPITTPPFCHPSLNFVIQNELVTKRICHPERSEGPQRPQPLPGVCFLRIQIGTKPPTSSIPIPKREARSLEHQEK